MTNLSPPDQLETKPSPQHYEKEDNKDQVNQNKNPEDIRRKRCEVLNI